MNEIESQIKLVKKLRDRVNNPDISCSAVLDEFRKARKKLTNLIMETSKDGRHVVVDRKVLTLLWKMDFPEKAVIYVGNYVIYVDGLKTEAASRDNVFVSLHPRQMPQYLREFVF